MLAVAWKRRGTGAHGGLSTFVVALAVIALVVLAQPTVHAQDSGLFRLVTFSVGGEARLGTTSGDGDQDVVDVHNALLYLQRASDAVVADLAYIPPDMKRLIEAGPSATDSVERVHDRIRSLRASGSFTDPGGERRVFYPPSAVRLLPPVPNPSKILGMAGNYPREGRNPEYPSAFLKPPSALVGQGEDIDLRGLVTRGVHEPEMAIVISKIAKNVAEADALDYVFGYTILNDVSSRDLPQGDHPSQGSTIAKGLDSFAPCGPFLTLKRDVPDPHNLDIEARLNGELQELPNANTRHLLFNVNQAIAYFSERMTLLPGDIIATGVPAPVVQLKAGDLAELTIGNLGTLRNRVVANGRK